MVQLYSWRDEPPHVLLVHIMESSPHEAVVLARLLDSSFRLYYGKYKNL